MSWAKAAVAVVIAVFIAFWSARTNGGVSAQEWVAIAIAGTQAVMVYLVPNTTRWPWAKAVVAGVLTMLNVLATAIPGGISDSDVMLIVAQLAALVGVAGITNKGYVLKPAIATVNAVEAGGRPAG